MELPVRDPMRWLALVLLCLGVAACRDTLPPATAGDLLLAAGDFPGLVRVEPVISVSDPGGDAAGPEALALRAQGMRSAARVEYHLRAPGGAVIRAHLMLFVDPPAAEAHWRGRHHRDALAGTQALAIGEAAWTAGGKEAELRAGPVVIVLQSREPYARLEDFARVSLAHAQERLRR